MNTPLIVILSLQSIMMIGLSVLVLAVIRQIGMLHQRVAPAGALTISQGVKPGERAPELR